MTFILLFLAFCIYRMDLPEIASENDDSTEKNAVNNPKSIFEFPHLLVGVIALFLYVGVEVIAADSIILLEHPRGLPCQPPNSLPALRLQEC